jgi:hypothetical protein
MDERDWDEAEAPKPEEEELEKAEGEDDAEEPRPVEELALEEIDQELMVGAYFSAPLLTFFSGLAAWCALTALGIVEEDWWVVGVIAIFSVVVVVHQRIVSIYEAAPALVIRILRLFSRMLVALFVLTGVLNTLNTAPKRFITRGIRRVVRVAATKSRRANHFPGIASHERLEALIKARREKLQRPPTGIERP